jgi:ribonuclease P protein component, eubacterial
MPENTNEFPKGERLCNKKAITSLFESGESCFVFSLKLYYKPNNLIINRILISIPKRAHKNAVDRNLLKRRIKESWRCGERGLFTGMDIAVIYISSSFNRNFHKIDKSLSDGLAKIKAALDKSSNSTSNISN